MRLIHIKKHKIGFIILSSVVALIIFALLIAYLYIHSMISKINIVDSSSGQVGVAAEDDMPEYLKNTGEEKQPAADAGSSTQQGLHKSNLIEENIPAELEETDLPAASEDELADIEEKIKSNISKNDIKYDKNVFNVLLIGSDSRKSGGTGRSDAMILVSINKKEKTISVTSILRDIYLKIAGKDTSNRINAAYAYGGADMLLDTVEQNFKIKIDKYVIIDFYAFIDVVDAVGGIAVKVTDKDIPIINGYVKELNRLTGKDINNDCLEEAGYLLLNGKQALGYSRNRYVGSDFTRTQKQREVLAQVYSKVKGLKWSRLIELMNRILPQLTTNLKEGEIFSLLLSLPLFIKYDIKQGTIPAKGTYKDVNIKGMAVLSIDFDKNIKILHESIYSDADR